MKSKLALAVLSVLVCAAFAPPETVIFDNDGRKLPDSEVNSPAVNWALLGIKGHRAYSGIGLVDIMGGGGCTGTFLDTGTAPDGPAYVLSNGHCAGSELMGRHDVLVDRPVERYMNFRFNYFVDAGAATYRVPIRRIAYATMHGTDVTVFELATTFGALTSRGYVPYRIASRDVAPGVRVEMIGIPQNGVARSKRFVRRSTCELGTRTNLREGGYEWFGSYRHQCSSVGGSSGSPMISLRTHEIVAINNTGVDDNALDAPECALDRPCEVAPNGQVRTDPLSNYAERVSDIPSCFDGEGRFDLNVEGCKLERP